MLHNIFILLCDSGFVVYTIYVGKVNRKGVAGRNVNIKKIKLRTGGLVIGEPFQVNCACIRINKNPTKTNKRDVLVLTIYMQ